MKREFIISILSFFFLEIRENPDSPEKLKELFLLVIGEADSDFFIEYFGLNF
jgi:hypothetical protein